jgi:hypothetical protein
VPIIYLYNYNKYHIYINFSNFCNIWTKLKLEN